MVDLACGQAQRTSKIIRGLQSSPRLNPGEGETFEGQTVWEGVVEVFALQGHPTATRCYVWSHTVDGSEKRRFVAVLHQGPVNSPKAAVRAAIIEEGRSSNRRA